MSLDQADVLMYPERSPLSRQSQTGRNDVEGRREDSREADMIP
jgi:hypothetical protein